MKHGSVILCTLTLEGTRCASVCMLMGIRMGKALVSVFAKLMRGGNDDKLKWPFKGTIKVILLNQLEDGQHLTVDMWSPDEDIPEFIRGCVTEGVRNGWGCEEFISHDDLDYCASRSCQYLKDGTLFFRVDCFEIELD